MEIGLSKNRAFLDKTGNARAILDYFDGKTRLEVNLENKRKIQRALSISDTDYRSVMGCRENIVLAQFDKIFGSCTSSVGEVSINNIVEYGLWNIIRYHNFDLQSIEQEIKDLRLYGDKTRGAMGKQMKKIRAMIDAHLAQNHPANDAVERIREELRLVPRPVPPV